MNATLMCNVQKNIFYIKPIHYPNMKDNSVSKIRQESESIDTTEHTTEIINFLEKLNLTNIPERKIFFENPSKPLSPVG